MSKRLLILVLFVAVTVFTFEFYRHAEDSIRGDEAAWIFSGVYLTHFLEGDRVNPDWSALDAIDQPPVAKYYYGLASRIGGGVWRTLDDKAWWLATSNDTYNAQSFIRELNRRISKQVIFWTRAAAAFAALFTCLGIYFLGTWISRPSVGAFGSLAFIFSGLVLHFVPIVEADFLLIGFIVWQLACLVRWVRAVLDLKKSAWAWALLSGFLLGLAVDTKLNGFLEFPVVAIAVLVTISASRSMAGVPLRILLQSVFMSLIATLTALWLNPTFSNITSLSQMIAHRSVQLAAVSLYTGTTDTTPLFSLALGWQHIFANFGLIIDSIYFPFGLLFASAGFVFVLVRFFGGGSFSTTRWIIFNAAIIWIVSAFWSFSKTLWIRYLLPVTPFLSLAIASGVIAFWKIYLKIRLDGFKKWLFSLDSCSIRVIILGALVFIVAWVAPVMVDARGALAAATTSFDVRIKRLEFSMRKHPSVSQVRLELADLYVQKGEYAEAANILKPVVGVNPQNKLLKALFETITQIAKDKRY